MEGFIPEVKYQKLASEYSKLRAQASVLKKAVLDEQSKNVSLRDQVRQKESALRRSEQEVDSLGFRNKQLEYRVASLQDELVASEKSRKDKDSKRGRGIGLGSVTKDATASVGNGGAIGSGNGSDTAQENLIFEELQKKIMENAQLTSSIDDRNKELKLLEEHINSLEAALEKRNAEQSEMEKRLRKELDTLQCRNSDLEAKLVDATSMIGSEDTLSASGSDTTPLHNHHQQLQINHHQHQHRQQNSTLEDRLFTLEKEAIHWRSQFELSKLYNDFINTKNIVDKSCTSTSTSTSTTNSTLSLLPELTNSNCDCSTTAAALIIKSYNAEVKSTKDWKESTVPKTKEQILFNNFCQRFEKLLTEKNCYTSQMISYETEIDHLQNCLENATHELKAKDEQIQSINQALQLIEGDLTTTRVNYEEQISVLTEQVINLSDQLAASK